MADLDLQLVSIEAQKVTLGWRFDAVIDENKVATESEYGFNDWFLKNCFSKQRTVELVSYEIASTTIPFEQLVSLDRCEDVSSYDDACELCNQELKKYGYRLPTEDEFECAVGGKLFAWGNHIPDGTPHHNTTFASHRTLSRLGLTLNNDPYKCELVLSAFKMGDGGVSICGGHDWPVAWLSLSPCFRAPDEMVGGCWLEYLEGAFVRPVALNGG